MNVGAIFLSIFKPTNHTFWYKSKFICCVLLVCFLFMIQTLYAQNFQTCNLKNTTTYSGEKLTYKVYYTFAGIYVPAGEATFSNTLETYNQKKVFHVKGEGHTYKSYDWFYKVRDLYESYIDTITLLPLKFVRTVSEGGHKINDHVVFNHQTNQAVSAKKTIKTTDCIQDVLSAIYYARNIDFSKYKINELIPFEMYLDDEIYPLYIRYLGKSTLKTKYGSYKTIMFKPKLIEGTLFKGGEEMTVFVTDDKYKIPVYIETPIVVGKVKVYLLPKGE